LRTQPAPAPTTDGAILLAVIATWVVSATADWLAFTRQAVLGALAPALVVFVWSSTLGTKDDWALSAAGFAVLAGCFLIAQNMALLERRRSWLVTRGRTRAPWLFPTALVSVVAVLGALALAPLVLDPDAGPLLDLNAPTGASSGSHSYNAGIAPLVDVGQKLRDTDVPDLFTVRSPVADYWRVTALDQFSSDGGGQWTLEAAGSGKVAVGLPDDVPAGAVTQRFSINDLGERWLPAAYRPVHISLADTLVVVSSWTLVTSEDTVRGLDYTVDSVLGPAGTEITPTQQAATAAAVPADHRQFATLPSDFPKEIGTLAANIVSAADATTPYAKAAALRDYFRSPAFVYDTSVDLGDDANAILTFLRDKRGFCVQFASAYAVMARSLGIPTRLAVGYTSGTRAPDGSTYTVGSHDAHAWPEVWLAGLGWTHLFDPTPATSSARIGGSDLANEPPVQQSPAATEQATTPMPSSPSSATSAASACSSRARTR
jgi:transglutaminase-like putative cysteine protease